METLISFWVLAPLMALTLLMFFLVEYQHWVIAAFAVIATILVVQFLGGLGLFSFMYHHPIVTLGCIAGYFVVGTAWSFIKWFLYSVDALEKYAEKKSAFLKVRGQSDGMIPHHLKEEWSRHIKNYYPWGTESIKPKVRDHAGIIITWMTYWPWSMLWALINDFVRRTFRYIYLYLRETYQAITDRVFRGVEQDFPGLSLLEPHEEDEEDEK